MRKIFLVFVLFTKVTYGASWVSVKADTNLVRNVVYDITSIKNYPGMVVFNARHEYQKTNVNQQTYYYFGKLAFLCGSKDLFNIASFMDTDRNSSKLYISEVGDIGINDRLSTPALLKPISNYCGGKNSKESQEIPVTADKNEVWMNLPKETVINGFRVVLWSKIFPWSKEPFKDVNDQPIVLNGETISKKVINRDLEYKLHAIEYDCSTKMSAALSFIEYLPSGNIKNSFDYSEKKSFTRVIPDSVGQANLEFACGLR